MQKNDIERQSLLHSNSLLTLNQGTCWCCWESTSSQENPLIRACLDCKDPDLQLIHSKCINSYINALPHTTKALDLQCTRCAYPYNITYLPINPFTIIVKDKQLTVYLAIMVLCIISLTWSSILLLRRDGGENAILFRLGQCHVGVTVFALFSLAFCHAVHISTWRVILRHYSGHTSKLVHAAVE
jgi:hypothetical protein